MTHRDRVNMTSDGLALSPGEYADLLSQLAAGGKLGADSYGQGGSVEKFEQAMAAQLGKEAALVMPTGTMANLLAVQFLAGIERKVIAQRESHLLNDSGDCAPGLAGLQLVPLGDRATFRATDVTAIIERVSHGRVDTPLGVICVETPVRRLDGEMFAFEALDEVVQLARTIGVRLHLDGARLPVVAACTGRSMDSIAAPFDTVYVSLYKCLNSLSGGIIAGDRPVMDRLHHWRRRNGGGMAQMWPMAAVAHHFLPSVVRRLEEAFEISETFFELLGRDGRFQHSPIAGGSSFSRIAIPGAEQETLQTFHDNLKARSIGLPPPDSDLPGFTIKVNESWRRTTAEDLYGAFQQSIAETDLEI